MKTAVSVKVNRYRVRALLLLPAMNMKALATGGVPACIFLKFLILNLNQRKKTRLNQNPKFLTDCSLYSLSREVAAELRKSDC